MEINHELFDLMECVRSACRHYDAASALALAGENIPAGLAAGVIKSIGDCTICDADGFALEPEQTAEGFVLTEKGNELLDAYEAERVAEFLSRQKK